MREAQVRCIMGDQHKNVAVWAAALDKSCNPMGSFPAVRARAFGFPGTPSCCLLRKGASHCHHWIGVHETLTGPTSAKGHRIAAASQETLLDRCSQDSHRRFRCSRTVPQDTGNTYHSLVNTFPVKFVGRSCNLRTAPCFNQWSCREGELQRQTQECGLHLVGAVAGRVGHIGKFRNGVQTALARWVTSWTCDSQTASLGVPADTVGHAVKISDWHNIPKHPSRA